MKIDIYKSTQNGNKYLSVPATTDVRDIKFPNNIDQDLLRLSPFKTSLEIDISKPIIALDENDVIEQIKEKGYAIHGTKSEIKISME